MIVTIGVFVVLFTPLTEWGYRLLKYTEKPKKAEAIVVLSCSAYPSGLPGYDTLVRLRKGLELYREGYADTIICSGGIYYDAIDKSIAELMKETLILNGVDAKAVLVQDETKNTFNDITGVIHKYSSRIDMDNTLFVSSAWHTYRIRKILDKKKVRAAVVAASAYEVLPQRWYRRLELFRQGIRELLAICWFKMKGYL